MTAAANVNLQFQGHAVTFPSGPVQDVVPWSGKHPSAVLLQSFPHSFLWSPRPHAKIAEFPADDSQDFATGSRIPQDFPRKSEAPPPTPLRPGACCTEASCVTHWILVRDPLKPSARSTEACPGELTPHQSPILRCLVTRMDQGSDFKPLPENPSGFIGDWEMSGAPRHHVLN